MTAIRLTFDALYLLGNSMLIIYYAFNLVIHASLFTWRTLTLVFLLIMCVCCRCTINWNQGKNVTVKVVKKVQKHKGRGTKRTVTQTVQRDSFFNFFSPPEGILCNVISAGFLVGLMYS